MQGYVVDDEVVFPIDDCYPLQYKRFFIQNCTGACDMTEKALTPRFWIFSNHRIAPTHECKPHKPKHLASLLRKGERELVFLSKTAGSLKRGYFPSTFTELLDPSSDVEPRTLTKQHLHNSMVRCLVRSDEDPKTCYDFPIRPDDPPNRGATDNLF